MICLESCTFWNTAHTIDISTIATEKTPTCIVFIESGHHRDIWATFGCYTDPGQMGGELVATQNYTVTVLAPVMGGQYGHDVVNLQFEELQMFKDLPGQCGQHGVLGQVSEGENEKETGETDDNKSSVRLSAY